MSSPDCNPGHEKPGATFRRLPGSFLTIPAAQGIKRAPDFLRDINQPTKDNACVE
jgi:multisubunit Na+/H+ antiporter MnhG subunit